MKRLRSRPGLPEGRAYGDGHHEPGWAGWNTFTQVIVALAAGVAIFYFALKIFARIDVVNSGHYDALAYLLGTVALAALSVGRITASVLATRKEKKPWGHEQRSPDASELQPETFHAGEKPKARRKPKLRRRF